MARVDSMMLAIAPHATRKETSTMLVLSRKPGERILIGDDIAVTVVRIGPNTVRLGIDAPRSMNIVRDELCHSEPEAAKPVQKAVAEQ
jgi:carbon storage regulator